VHDNYKKYSFDYTFDGTESMEKVYANVVGVVKAKEFSSYKAPLIERVAKGIACAG